MLTFLPASNLCSGLPVVGGARYKIWSGPASVITTLMLFPYVPGVFPAHFQLLEAVSIVASYSSKFLINGGVTPLVVVSLIVVLLVVTVSSVTVTPSVCDDAAVPSWARVTVKSLVLIPVTCIISSVILM